MPAARTHRPETGHHLIGESPDDPSLARIGSFSDGVFAFAITLLILAIRIPHPSDADAGKGLLTLLTEQWRSYLAFGLSFMLVGINWANHRVMLATFARANHALVWLNLVYLMLAVVLMPIPTAVMGAWMGNPNDQVVAAAFYGIAATIGGLAYNVLWWYGAYVAKITYPTLTAEHIRAHTVAWASAPVVMAILTAVAFANPSVAVVGYVATVFLYVLPVPRLIALKHQSRDQTQD